MNSISTRSIIRFFVFAALVFGPTLCSAQIERNSLAQTPPMGWNSWNKFACNVSEDLIKTVADAMATNGMKDAGYQYVVIDDCWQVERDDARQHRRRSPSASLPGIKALADYIHAQRPEVRHLFRRGHKNLRRTVPAAGARIPGCPPICRVGRRLSQVRLVQHTARSNAEEAYTTMSDALLATGRPIVFSMCEWGTAKPWLWGKGIGNLWRTRATSAITGRCTRSGMTGPAVKMAWSIFWISRSACEAFAGPGHWNDPDMMEVGNGGMTTTEYRSHFSFWAMLAAPLIAGNDVRSMSADTKEILENKEVIAINQDPLGRQGRRISKQGDLEVWSRPLADGSRAVILFNRGASEAEISVTWEQLAYPGHLSAAVRDLWEHKDLGTFTGGYKTKVASHAVAMLKIKP